MLPGERGYIPHDRYGHYSSSARIYRQAAQNCDIELNTGLNTNGFANIAQLAQFYCILSAT